MRYSILLATFGRTNELHQFFRSLSRQTYRDFEVIVIDQNQEDVLALILDRYAREFPIRRLTSEPGHSRAFNVGLSQADGELIAFPDDDCWYDDRLLERVAGLLDANPGWGGITGREIVEPGFACGGRWDRESGPLTRSNVFRRAICFSMFLRREVAVKYSFDETLGVGAQSRWGAGEETDYLLRIIERGHRIQYDPSIRIWHQGRSGPYTAQTYRRARSYACGMGRVLRAHDYPMWSVMNHWIRPMGGALLSLALGRTQKARLHWSIFEGRVDGWLLRADEKRSEKHFRSKPLEAAAKASEDLR